MAKTKRYQNKCKDCGYTWYPRGKDISTSCPRCGSKNVGLAGSWVFLLAIIAAVVLYSALRGGENTYSQPGGNQQAEEIKNIGNANIKQELHHKKLNQEELPQNNKMQNELKKPDATNENEVAKEQEKIFSDEEIATMENEKQYHGDDPIVRARLGLPSRTTKKIE